MIDLFLFQSNGTMDTQSRKLHLIKQILELEDKRIITRLERVLTKEFLLNDEVDFESGLLISNSEPAPFKVINAEELREVAKKWM
jgi:hypothetical protein